MSGLWRWAVRHPVRAAILTGLLISGVLTLVSFPEDKTVVKTVSGWRPPNYVAQGPVKERLQEALQEPPSGVEHVEVSDEEFFELAPPASYAEPVVSDDGRRFAVRYAGEAASVAGRLYTATRELDIGPWWSPQRLAYKAVEAQVDEARDVLRLTYERDMEGLFGLLLMDMAVGAIYGVVVGCILSIFGLEGLDRRPKPRQQPAAGKGWLPAAADLPRQSFASLRGELYEAASQGRMNRPRI